MIKYIITGLSCLLSLFISGQDQFVVYSTNGKVIILQNNKSFIAKPGQTIYSNSSVTIPKEAGITLICEEGGFHSLTQPGTYSLYVTRDSCRASNSRILNNFFKYLWDQTNKQYPDPGKRRIDYFDNAGPVTRDLFDIWVSRAFDTLNYSGIDGAFPIYWKSYRDSKKYIFSLYDSGNTARPFYRTGVRDLKIELVDLTSQIKPGKTYYWSVSTGGEYDDPLYVLNYVTNKRFTTILSNIDQQKPAVEGSAEEAFRTAFILENAHYLAEAHQYYTRAANLDPENLLYRSALLSFRNDYEINR